MPLIDRDYGGEEEVEIDGDTYWLRRELGWYARKKANQAKGIAVHVPWSKVKDGELRIMQNDMVPITMDATEDAELQRLLIWISRWSHKEPINEKTVKRLPMNHARILLRRIKELEKEQDGPAEESPLAKSSGNSSGE